MSGHSKWHTIKHKKGAIDAKRGKIFTKIIKEITVAAKIGGGDPEANPRLRTVLLKAKAANMPKDNIERAIKKGTGDLEGVEYVELLYEGYAPHGVAVLIETLTDNKNRTAADVRNILQKNGGSLGASGCVAYLFARKGLIALSPEQYSEDAVMEVALESGAEDIVNEGSSIDVITETDTFEDVLEALERKSFNHEMAEITMIADVQISLDAEKTTKVLNLIDKLEDNDDVQNVYHNMEIPEDFEPVED